MKTTTTNSAWTKTVTIATVLTAAALTAGIANAHGGGGGGGGGGHSGSGSGSHSMSRSSSSSSSFKQSTFKSSNLLSNNSSSQNFKKINSGVTSTRTNKPIAGVTNVSKLPIHGTPITSTGNPGNGKGTGNSHHHGSCWNNFIFLGLGYPFYGSYPYRSGTTGYNTTYYNNSYVTPVSTATPAKTVDGIDLQLVDVRVLDRGRPDEQIGPRYRVTFRNVGSTPVDHEFNVALAATTEMKVSDNMPEATARVTDLTGNETKFVDIRLPASVFEMTTTAGGNTEYSKLLVFVDSNQEVNDTHRENNMAGLERNTIKTAE